MNNRYLSPVYMCNVYINKMGIKMGAEYGNGTSILFQDNPF